MAPNNNNTDILLLISNWNSSADQSRPLLQIKPPYYCDGRCGTIVGELSELCPDCDEKIKECPLCGEDSSDRIEWLRWCDTGVCDDCVDHEETKNFFRSRRSRQEATTMIQKIWRGYVVRVWLKKEYLSWSF